MLLAQLAMLRNELPLTNILRIEHGRSVGRGFERVETDSSHEHATKQRWGGSFGRLENYNNFLFIYYHFSYL